MSFLNNLNAFLESEDVLVNEPKARYYTRIVPSSPPRGEESASLVPKDWSSFRYNGDLGVIAVPVPSSSLNRSYDLSNCNQDYSHVNDSRLSSTFSSVIPRLRVDVLPREQRCVFPFHEFNEMQSKCFNTVYGTIRNCVLSSPTGSGKTVVFELAILRANETLYDYKVLYLAPTKALCSERKDDWSKKFAPLGITVGMLTGDTSYKEAESVRDSNIIISTPEKWDMITRKWNDYKKLFSLIKLLLVDEVHVLKEPRGATLEVVMTRMKRICVGLRILAISATVANAHDISTWLDAETLVFGEEYRAVKLQKVVYGYKPSNENDFSFDNQLNSKLIEVIDKHSLGKPVLIFCATRNSCQFTARCLGEKVCGKGTILKLKDRELAGLVKSGVGYHHAGLTFTDRKQIEAAFLSGDLRYLCCTSTLAVGINLPAYLVVIKGTKCWCESTFQEYSETDILQMIGRAGRPQFENEGVSIIMTNNKLKSKYERLIMGTEKVESSLHLNFAENLLAETAVGNISSIEDALGWLKTTYFYVRFLINPSYYDIPKPTTTEENLLRFCKNETNALIKENLICDFKCTAFGLSMTMHYIKFDTMKVILHSGEQLTISELFNVFARAAEFSDLKIKHQEKRLYKELNKSPLMRYPSESKVSTIIQYELGGLEFPSYNGAQKLQSSFLGDKFYVFKHVSRILKAMMDVFVAKKDAKSLINSGYAMRSIAAKGWEGSPNELKQLDNIGVQSIKKLVNHNVLTLMDVKTLSQTQIEQFLGLKVGAGAKLRKSLSAIPSISIDAHLNGSLIQVHIRVEPTTKAFKNDALYLQVISSSGGRLVDFRRTPLKNYNDSGFVVPYSSSKVEIEASIMCGVSSRFVIGEDKGPIVDVDLDFEFSSSSTSLSGIFAVERVKNVVAGDQSKETCAASVNGDTEEDNTGISHSLPNPCFTVDVAPANTNRTRRKKKVKRKKSIFDIHSDDSDDTISNDIVERKKPKLGLNEAPKITNLSSREYKQPLSRKDITRQPETRGEPNEGKKVEASDFVGPIGEACIIGKVGTVHHIKKIEDEEVTSATTESLALDNQVSTTMRHVFDIQQCGGSQGNTEVEGSVVEEFQQFFGSDILIE
ncbi:HFM1 [Candida margitis]|uniref:HFM1 n=1 Tax=Candida margitis TaxID=1775924 RepID=UPI00222788BA|nr:HFM1 [Candida margitis]KAI5969396.1 HFM1 [Candida margitis]